MPDSPSAATPGGRAIEGAATATVLTAVAPIVTALLQQPHGAPYALAAGVIGAGIVAAFKYFGAPKTATAVATAIDTSGLKTAAYNAGLAEISARLDDLAAKHQNNASLIGQVTSSLQAVQSDVNGLQTVASAVTSVTSTANAASMKADVATNKSENLGGAVTSMAEQLNATNNSVTRALGIAADASSLATEAKSAIGLVQKLVDEVHGQVKDVQKAHNSLANALKDDAFKSSSDPASTTVPIK